MKHWAWLWGVALLCAACEGVDEKAPRSSSDAATSDASLCRVYAAETGCSGASSLAITYEGAPATRADSRRCASEGAGDAVRLRLCVAPPRATCDADDGVGYCAVIELPRARIGAAATVPLDGDARFTYPSPMVYRVAPEDVSYTVTSPTAAAATRAWVEKECFCTPTSLGGTQRLTGELRIERASGRLRGRVSLRAEGVISPTTWRSERVDLATEFDLPDPS